MYRTGQIEALRGYCLSDVAQTAFLFLRYRLLSGLLDRRRLHRRRDPPPVGHLRGSAPGPARRAHRARGCCSSSRVGSRPAARGRAWEPFQGYRQMRACRKAALASASRCASCSSHRPWCNSIRSTRPCQSWRRSCAKRDTKSRRRIFLWDWPCACFRPEGVTAVERALRRKFQGRRRPASVRHFLVHAAKIRAAVADVVLFLQGRAPTVSQVCSPE
jgi:hypothetical protein